MRITKLAAAAAVALVAAAPVAMAGGFSTGTITALDQAQGTISIGGTPYQLRSGALRGDLKVGQAVAYESDSHGMSNSVYLVEPTATVATPAAQSAQFSNVPMSGDAKAAATGQLGAPVGFTVVPKSARPVLSGSQKSLAQARNTYSL